jgi:ABC-type multidrug transport system fused ATPase/permease subunit
MAYVPQETALFRGTLRQNLDLESLYSDESLIKSLKRVGLETWFNGLHEGLDFKIEEKGKNLSLGERQLVCLSRASLKESPMIILDEATSSIDPQTEELVDAALRNVFKGKTQLIVAHRLSTLENCDKILWIHRGSIKIFGKPELVLPLFKNADLAHLDLQKNL